MKCQYAQMSATGKVKDGLACYHGYIVVTAVATASILIRDGLAGLVIDTIPAATAAGSAKVLTQPVATQSTNGLYFDLNGGTGTVNVLYE